MCPTRISSPWTWEVNPLTMNDYGRLAEAHMREFLPTAYAAIADKDSYFSSLGDEIEQQVWSLVRDIADPGTESEPFMERVGHLNMAKLMAEEKVLAEMCFLPPEKGAQPDEPETDETGAFVGGPPGWTPRPTPFDWDPELDESTD